MSRLRVSDAFCYICRGVLIEPVTVPCLHVFCRACFEQSMQETSYSCPLCRRRISNWVRTAKKTDKLINAELWKKIKEQFRDEVHSKLRGEDDGLDERLKAECPAHVTLSGPGEVAKEFSKLINDYETERKRREAAEELASKELIEKLTEEEKCELDAFINDNIQKAMKDEELAKKLHEEMNKEVPTSSQELASSRKKKKKSVKGPMDSYVKGSAGVKKRNGLKVIVQEKVNYRSTSSDSTDSIQSEMHHFKPIKVVPRTPPKRYPDGKVVEIAVTKVKPLKLSNCSTGMDSNATKRSIVESKKIHSPYSAFIGKVMPHRGIDSSAESPRKRLRSSADEVDIGVLKEITLGENSDSNSMGPTDVDSRVGQSEGVKKKGRASPKGAAAAAAAAKKGAQASYLMPPKLYHFDEAKKNENADGAAAPPFETQDYLVPEADLEEKLIEEQRRIEEMISQEKADRELALKLSQEWQGRYELRRKPKLKQIAVRRKTRGHENKKIQQTLITSLVKTRSRSK